MRNGQNKQRMRNRNNNNNNQNHRRSQNPMSRVYESNGPDIKIRGTPSHIAEKYLQLARDARSSGDPVAAENYYQHAEHYFRLIAAAQEQLRQNQPQQQMQPRQDDFMNEDGEDESENFSNFGQEPGFVPQPQPQPFMRDNNQRDHQREHQPYPRDHQQPREQRDHQPREQRDFRQQPQFQPAPQAQPQPATGENGSVDRLPSFITGGQPQANGAPEAGANERGERFPRRRRRPHGPRPEREAAPASSDDLAPGE